MIQYPSGKKRTANAQSSPVTSGRGMRLEEDINQTNSYYRTHNIAVVYKKPTPIQVVKVDYPARNKARISEAYYRQASTTDYNGVYDGYALDFEAKETKNKTLFPLSSLHDHQIDHLKAVTNHGAIAFLLIRFSSLDETYLIFALDFLPYINKSERRSIPLTWIRENGYLVDGNYIKPCDYIPIIKTYLNKESL